MKPFRIESIRLDEDHSVAGVTVVIDAPYLANVNTLLYDGEDRARVVRRERGDTELWVELDAGDVLDLFSALGKQVESDPLWVPGGYDALSLVVYGLMED